MAAKSMEWIHMVGIAGAGMSGIAKVLLKQGKKVSGSDLQYSKTIEDLRQQGILTYKGHSSSNMQPGIDLVVYSSAVPLDNEEIKWAMANNIPVLKRGEMLARLVQGKKTIAVAGAHGKTTTTAMVYTILQQCGLDPSFIVGGELQENNANAQLGQGDYFVVEADESDASFLELKPYIAVITNIEDDHLDYYKSVENLKNAFYEFVSQVDCQGLALLYGGDEYNRAIKKRNNTKILLYGEDDSCEYYFKNWLNTGTGSTFDVYHGKDYLGKAEISIPGRHNACNALAAIAIAQENGLPFSDIQAGIKKYRGTKRRFQVIGVNEKFTVVDDYAHHPTEIKATIEAARNYHQTGRIIVVFQPHRYSRTQLLGRELGEAFEKVDKVIISDIYSAGEKPLAGVTGELIYKAAIKKGCPAIYIPDVIEIESHLMADIRENDLIITMGAGDIWKLGLSLLHKASQSISNP